jgi:hypothetical protein
MRSDDTENDRQPHTDGNGWTRFHGNHCNRFVDRYVKPQLSLPSNLPISSTSERHGNTLSNSPDCKRQLSRRHLLANLGIDQVRQ